MTNTSAFQRPRSTAKTRRLGSALTRALLPFALSWFAALGAHAQIIGFEIPASELESPRNCGYQGNAPASCDENNDRNPFNEIGALKTAAFRADGDRVCGKTDAAAHTGSCYISLMRNARDGFSPTAQWNGTWINGAPDQQGQVFSVSYTGTGARSVSVFSRANAFARYAGNSTYPAGYVGGDGLMQVYSRDSAAGTGGWTLLGTQICTNTAVWAQCSIAFTIPSTAQQVAFLLAPSPREVTDYMAADFDDVDVSGLRPVIVAAADDFNVPSSGATTASVGGNDTIGGVPAAVGTNVSLAPGTQPTVAAGSITMANDGNIVVAPGTTAGTYSYPYEICALPALVPALCTNAVATVTVAATAPPSASSATPVPTLSQWALLALSALLGMLGLWRFVRPH